MYDGNGVKEGERETENYSAVLKSTESLQNKHKRHTHTHKTYIYITVHSKRFSQKVSKINVCVCNG